ncbi:MAG: ISKra4 family transposase, partial [Thermosynechococcaceae cyanobacterium]
MAELCCLRLAATTSFGQASEDIELMCGIQVSPSTIERTSERNPISAAESEEAVEEISLDGSMVRLVTPKGQPSEWKEYKAVRLNGDGSCSVWFKDNPSLLMWTQRLVWASVVYCLGDGHCGVWSLFAQMTGISEREEILDWFHLKENLHKVGG